MSSYVWQKRVLKNNKKDKKNNAKKRAKAVILPVWITISIHAHDKKKDFQCRDFCQYKTLILLVFL